MEDIIEMKALFVIVNAGFEDEVVDIIRKCGSQGATIINARGTAGSYAKKTLLSIQYEPEKEIVISLVSSEIAENIMQVLPQKLGVASPANGICFCMPVNKMTLINKQSLNEST
ncbi:MAG: P-II family nitrogen regulator [Christensenellaceae bacterium]|jgi:nitrogen regulatory protein PII|nr:P-II family nitrogen regulator [Christensenellaceae bacterium]